MHDSFPFFHETFRFINFRCLVHCRRRRKTPPAGANLHFVMPLDENLTLYHGYDSHRDTLAALHIS